MAKLAKIVVRHCSPKDKHESIEKYVICDNEEQVFNHLYQKYSEDWDNEEKNEKTQDYMSCRGEFYSDNANWDDAYYGITHFGWKEPVEISPEDVVVLLRLNIVLDIRGG